jgi:hypothetical protein
MIMGFSTLPVARFAWFLFCLLQDDDEANPGKQDDD